MIKGRPKKKKKDEATEEMTNGRNKGGCSQLRNSKNTKNIYKKILAFQKEAKHE